MLNTFEKIKIKLKYKMFKYELFELEYFNAC